MSAVEADKNEVGSTKADPYVQGSTYYLHFWRNRHDSFYHQNSCCPSLLLEVVGACLRVSALAFGARVMVQPLTPYLHIMAMQRHDPCHMEATARALLAYRIIVNLLNTYCEQLMQASYQPMQQPAVQLQLAQQVWMGQHTSMGVVPRELVVAGLPWRLQNPALRIQQLMQDRPLYLVQLDQQPRRLFKYTERYSCDVHRLLAGSESPLAPLLHSCIVLPGGMYEVQMEFLAAEEGWQMLQDCSDIVAARGAALQALARVHGLQMLDAGGIARRVVLGDARDSNVMVRTTQAGGVEVRFVDMDWAGFEGEARYPPFMSPMVAWPDGAADGELITQQHDTLLLGSAVQYSTFARSWAT